MTEPRPCPLPGGLLSGLPMPDPRLASPRLPGLPSLPFGGLQLAACVGAAPVRALGPRGLRPAAPAPALPPPLAAKPRPAVPAPGGQNA